VSKRLAVILADGFEEIEAVTVIDILRRAELEVIICGLKAGMATGAHDLKIAVDMKLDDLKTNLDGIVLPGGMPGATHLAASKKVKDIIVKMHSEGKIVAAICASPAVVLAPTGILSGRKATVYPGMEDGFGKDTIFSKDSVVVDGNIITSRAPGTALIFALAIVKKLKGAKEAEEIGRKTLVS